MIPMVSGNISCGVRGCPLPPRRRFATSVVASTCRTIGAKDLRVGGLLDGHAGGCPVCSQRSDQGGRPPMPGRSTVMDPRSTPGTPPQPDPIGLGRRDSSRNTREPATPAYAIPAARPPGACFQVFPILLAGAERLFLCVRFSAAGERNEWPEREQDKACGSPQFGQGKGPVAPPAKLRLSLRRCRSRILGFCARKSGAALRCRRCGGVVAIPVS